METLQETLAANPWLEPIMEAEANLRKTLEETQQSLIASATCGSLTQAEYNRVIANISRDYFVFKSKMDEVANEAASAWSHEDVTPTDEYRQNIDARNQSDAIARHYVREFLIRAAPKEVSNRSGHNAAGAACRAG